MFSPRTPTRFRTQAKTPISARTVGAAPTNPNVPTTPQRAAPVSPMVLGSPITLHAGRSTLRRSSSGKSTPRVRKRERGTPMSEARTGARPVPCSPRPPKRGQLAVPAESGKGALRPPSPDLYSPGPSTLPALAAHTKRTIARAGVDLTEEDEIFLAEMRRLAGHRYYEGEGVCHGFKTRMAGLLERERARMNGILEERMGEQVEQEVKGKGVGVEEGGEEEEQAGTKRSMAGAEDEGRERQSKKRRRTRRGAVECGVQTVPERGPTPPPFTAADLPGNTLPPTPPETPAGPSPTKESSVDHEQNQCAPETEAHTDCEEETSMSQGKDQIEVARCAAEEAAEREQAVCAATAAAEAEAVAQAESLRRQASLFEQALLEREAREARVQAAREAEAVSAAHLAALAEQRLQEAREAERRAKEEAERMRMEEEERVKARRVAEDIARSLAEKARRCAEERLAQAEALEARLRAAAAEEERVRAEAEERRALEARIIGAVQAAESQLLLCREAFDARCASLASLLEDSAMSFVDKRGVLGELRTAYDLYTSQVEIYEAEMQQIAAESSVGAKYVRERAGALLSSEWARRTEFERAWEVETERVAQDEIPMRTAPDVPMRDASGIMDRSMESVTDDMPYADSDDEDINLPQADDDLNDDSDPHTDTEMDDVPTRASTPRPPSPSPPPAPAPAPVPRPATSQSDFFETWEAQWKYVRNTESLLDVHFTSLPWPVLDVPYLSATACPVHVQGPEDITFERVKRFFETYAAYYEFSAAASMKKKVHGWLCAYHSDKSDAILVNKLHPAHRETAKEILKACTIHLVNIKKMCG